MSLSIVGGALAKLTEDIAPAPLAFPLLINPLISSPTYPLRKLLPYCNLAIAAATTKQVVRDVFEVNSQIITDPISGTPMCVPIARSHPASA
ncbi:MAG: hypothetical protein HC895_00040 [Leptolyngbyaceae cyanobacterium SM1_3_5]|nr:hypothetical protein [Leptolyngbyaceae cyanobacterium SM1_3_5]